MAAKPKEDIVWAPHYGPQAVFLNCDEFEVLFGGAKGGGKASFINDLVVTPSGMKRMGDIEVGSFVSSPDGTATKVIGVYPQGVVDLYEVRFVDGSQCIVSKDHRWVANVDSIPDSLILTTGVLMFLLSTGSEIVLPLALCDETKAMTRSECHAHTKIKAIESIGKDEAQCIRVEHPNGLYMVNDFIVTHNSEALVIMAIKPPYIQHPKYRGLILRRTFPRLLELKDRCDHYYRLVDPGCTFNKEERRYSFSSGAKVRLGHCEHEEDKYNYWGHEYHVVCIDQLDEFSETQYEILRMSARSTVRELTPIIRCTSNPGVQWVKERFVDVAEPGKVFEFETPDKKVLTRRFIPARVYDNPTLLERDPNYLSVLQSIDNERLRRQMLEGDWNVAEDSCFGEFDSKIHVKRLSDLFDGKAVPPEGWFVAASMDWGFSKPFAFHWHVITPYDRIITFKEWYGIKYDHTKQKYKANTGIQMLAAEVATRFVQRSQGLDVSYLVADRSIWNKLGQESGSVGQEMEGILADAGIPMVRSDSSPGSRMVRKIQIHNRLAKSPDGQPWWLIADCCTHLIRTLPMMRPDPNKPDEMDSSTEDHAVDSIGYFMQQFPLQLELSRSRISDAVLKEDEYRRNMIPYRGYKGGAIANTYN